jgi:hypothetical protein
MSKNMTQKGLALGAAAALIAAGLSAVPANAAGLADTSFVSLDPSTGVEYNVLAITGSEFSLTSNEATSVSSGDLKWLVTDASGVVEPKNAGSTLESQTIASASASTSVLTVNITGHGLNTGDVVAISGVIIVTDANDAASNANTDAADTEINDASYVVTKVNANSFTVAETFAGALLAADPDDNASTKFIKPATGAVKTLRTVRSATSTYVVDSGSTSDNADEIVILVKDASVTARTVTVQAWMDSNDNSLVDSTEYTSPARTVNWLAASSVTAATSVDYPAVGATSVTGSLTLTPNLNGQQQSATTDVQIGFTRPGSTATIYADATQNVTTRGWSASQSLATGFWTGMPHIKALTTSALTSNVVTVTTDVAHGIVVEDMVIVDGSQGIDVATTTAVTVIGSTTTFSYAKTASNIGSSADTGYARVVSRVIASVATTATVATVTTDAVHGLQIGDLVDIAGLGGAQAAEVNGVGVITVASVPTTTSFTFTGAFTASGTYTANASALMDLKG